MQKWVNMLQYSRTNEQDTRQGGSRWGCKIKRTGQQLGLIEAGGWLHEIHYVILLFYIFEICHKKCFET